MKTDQESLNDPKHIYQYYYQGSVSSIVYTGGINALVIFKRVGLTHLQDKMDLNYLS